MACWRTKAAISLKRVKIEEKLLWRAYRKSPTLFRTVPSPTPYGLPFPKIGVHNPRTPPQNRNHYYLRNGKATAANVANIFTGSIGTEAHEKFCRKGSVGISRDGPIFLSTPYYLRNGVNYEGQIWQVYSQGPTEQKPFKILGENGVWAYPGTAQIFEYPLLSHERVKLGTSNSVRTFLVSIGTKAHYKNLEK